MRPLRMVGLGLAVVMAVAAGMAASASAALPEWGRCVHVATPKTGEYSGAKCTVPAAGKGEYNFLPGPGPKPKFSGVGEKVALETPGKLIITCGADDFEGSYTGAKTETVTITLKGCIRPSGQKCQTNPLKAGEIELQPLEGEIGFIRTGEKPLVGLDLRPQSPSTTVGTFQCGTFPETGPSGVIEGSVIAPIKPLNHMTGEFKLVYTVVSGKQAVQHFEGGPNDTLTVKLLSGTETKTEEIGLRSLVVDSNEEPFEIKAK